MTSLARRERHALCDLALELGEDAPTLCGDWTTKDLMVHLVVREYSPVGASGIAVGALSKVTDLEMKRVGRKDFGSLVEKVRGRGLTFYSLPVLDRLFNTLEYFVHHEDLRRAQPGWEPRTLDPVDEDGLWRAIRVAAPGLTRKTGVPLRIRRTDTGASQTVRPGSDPVEVAGPVSEVVLYLFGRDQVRGLSVDGPPQRVASLRTSERGV